MKIETAIKTLVIKHEIAQKNTRIVKPISWALYQTWKEIDKKEKPNDRSGIEICTNCCYYKGSRCQKMIDNNNKPVKTIWSQKCKNGDFVKKGKADGLEENRDGES